MQTLTVVNDMLATLGESPLNSLSDPHEFKASALSTLDSHNKQIQAKGWWFNRDRVTLPLATDGTLVLPGDTLSYVSDTPGYVKRGFLVYNQIESTSTFTAADTGVIVRLVPFEQLDELPAGYISTAATLWFQQNFDADRAKTENLITKLRGMANDLGAEDIRQTGANLINNNVRLQRIKRATTTSRYQ